MLAVPEAQRLVPLGLVTDPTPLAVPQTPLAIGLVEQLTFVPPPEPLHDQVQGFEP